MLTQFYFSLCIYQSHHRPAQMRTRFRQFANILLFGFSQSIFTASSAYKIEKNGYI